MRRVLMVALIGAVMTAAGAGATDIDLLPDITGDELTDLANHLAEVIDPPAGPAKHLGITGLDIQVGVVAINADDRSSWWQSSLAGYNGFVGADLGSYRASVLKGLPKGIDVGGHAGAVAGADFWSAEVRAALLRGGIATPAVGLRLSWTTLAEGPLDLKVLTAQAMISKGFGPFTPYAAAGMRQVKADVTFAGAEPFAVQHEVDSSTFVANAGLNITLPPLAIRIEARRGTTTAAFVSAGIRF